ncbi:MAG TPA: apolipoprotein N-acyltransferase [Candidatus Binatia bacterium]|nr:apolipoprotein N-acyltransferase [Candidatus Binatia bacterium]
MADAQPLSRSALLAILGGLATAASFLRFELWPLGWVAFTPILLSLDRPQTLRRSVGLGIVAGLATNVPAFWWLVHTIHVFGGFPLWLSAIFYLGLSLYSSLEFVLLALAVRVAGFGPVAVYPAIFWVMLEFLYPSLFPWRMANCQLRLPVLLQIGELTGPFGLSLCMVWTGAALAAVTQQGIRSARSALACAAIATAAVASYGLVRLPAMEQAIAAVPPIRVGIVQGNLTIEEKQDVRYLEGNLDTYKRLTIALSPPPDVVIWPESVITEPLPRTLRRLSDAGRELLGLRRPLFAGALTYEGDPKAPRFFNSIMLFDADGRVLGTSDKQILMPFGEYMPLGSVVPWLKQVSPQTGDFQAGTEAVPLDVPGVARFAPLNCYEDLRAPIARRAVGDGGGEILFAVANDGWFGDTIAPFQHEALALWRAVENRRYLVRVTNTGVSDVIDPMGRVLLRLPVFEAAATVAEIRPLRLASPYTRFGDWFAWLVTAAGLAALSIAVGSRGRSALPNRLRPPA